MTFHSESLVRDVSRMAQLMRIDVLKMVYGANSGHIGVCTSARAI